MLITQDIFQSFLKCETKAYLKYLGEVGSQREFADWEMKLADDYKQKCFSELRSNYRDDECLIAVSFPQALENKKCRLVLDCVVRSQGLESNISALERSDLPSKAKHNPFSPIQFIQREKVNKPDKLLLAFDVLALSTASSKQPMFGKVIYGAAHSVAKLKLDKLIAEAKAVVSKIAAQQANDSPPQLILNKHCAECEFQARCRKVAIEKDDLSLFTRLSEKERKQHHSKGIFTVTQLSYTFRPRRRPKRLASRPEKYSHALKALAIRENKIHVAGRPELNLKGTPVYLDVEGIPDQDFYYLIGLRFKDDDSYVQRSLWANDKSEEKEIWDSFLQTLAKIENPQLIHYGSYETTFLKQMKERYCGDSDNTVFVDRLIAESLNLLSIIYANIYFPTFSNGLKEIAKYLGFQWAESDISGLKAIFWRSKWKFSRDYGLMQRLITYNAEDCEALERVTTTVAKLCQKQVQAAKPVGNDVVYTDSMKTESLYRFGKNNFSVPDMEHINRAAYWDYQREKIYVRSSHQLRHISRKNTKACQAAITVNKIIECPSPICCPHCKESTIFKNRRKSKIVRDLKFERTGVKRWIIKFIYYRYLCSHCGATFLSEEQKALTRSKYGHNVMAYLIYLIIELCVSQHLATQSLHDLFRLNRIGNGNSIVTYQKSKASQFYSCTYESILKKVVAGKLIQADETKIRIDGKDAYVWVFTSLEEVIYHFTETREGSFLQNMLQGFNGVLVSDFYTAYDSIDCPQQKCLIHLMRDLNDDLLKHPFNEELKDLACEFATLLKSIIETIDRFGLKAHFLRKHKTFAERFYKRLTKNDYGTEIAIYYRKRFEKNRDSLFTFLDYDGIPWNNNNAEHAIKAFAKLRKRIGESSSDKGIREYLTLLSICETCKYKGISFLDFLRSGEKDIDEFIKQSTKRRKS